eukprot:m.15443 g.15443  ORF g.15443 m.15443 type:complete len:1280 (+) comp10749_c0_seq1:405-4244(+)
MSSKFVDEVTRAALRVIRTANGRSSTGSALPRDQPSSSLSPETRGHGDVITCACRAGNLDAVKAAVVACADVNCRDVKGWTPLLWAAHNEYAEIVDVLVKANADVNVTLSCGTTPLMLSAENGNEHIVRYLVSANADVTAERKGGGTALSLAVESSEGSVVEVFLGASANVETRDKDHCTPLMVAAASGYVGIVLQLLSANADPAAVDQDGTNAVLFAAKMGYYKVMETLVAVGVSTAVVDARGYTPLMWASRNGHIRIVRMLLASQTYTDIWTENKDGHTAIELASMGQHFDVYRLLHEQPSVLQLTPLCRALQLCACEGPGREILARLGVSAEIVALVKSIQGIASTTNAPPPCIADIWDSLGRIDHLLLLLERKQQHIKDLCMGASAEGAVDACVAERDDVRMQLVDLARVVSSRISAESSSIDEFHEQIARNIDDLTPLIEACSECSTSVYASQSVEASDSGDTTANDADVKTADGAAEGSRGSTAVGGDSSESASGDDGHVSPLRLDISPSASPRSSVSGGAKVPRTLSTSSLALPHTIGLGSIADMGTEATAAAIAWQNSLRDKFIEQQTCLQRHVNAYMLRSDAALSPSVDNVDRMAKFFAVQLRHIVLILSSMDNELAPWKDTFPTQAVAVGAQRLLHALHEHAARCRSLVDHGEILRARVRTLEQQLAHPPDVTKFERIRQKAVKCKRRVSRTKLDVEEAMEDDDADAVGAATQEYREAQQQYQFSCAERDRMAAEYAQAVMEHYPEQWPALSSMVMGSATWTLRQLGIVHDDFDLAVLDHRPIHSAGRHEVYAATLPDGTRCALKKYTLVSDEQFQVFQREVTLLHRLSHPNVVALHGVHLDHNVANAYVQMQLCSGGTLQEWLPKQGSLEGEVTRAIVLQLVLAVLHLHSNKIIHSDIHPTNILMHNADTESGDGGGRWMALLGDFDVSLDVSSRTALTSVTRIGGREDYTAPEVHVGNRVTYKADVYALGLVIRLLRAHTTWDTGEAKGIDMLVDGMLLEDPSERLDMHGVLQCAYLAADHLAHAPSPTPFQPPSYWEHRTVTSSNYFQLYPAVDLHEEIQTLLRETMHIDHREGCLGKPGMGGAVVTRVLRVENSRLWKRYCTRREEMQSCDAVAPITIHGHTMLDPSINEVHLFHGTDPDTARLIGEYGFDERVSAKSGLYGCGTYFASDSCKSMQYTKGANENGEYTFLLTRVLLGDAFSTTTWLKELRRAPLKTLGTLYDSVVAWEGTSISCGMQVRQQGHDEFIVYDRAQTYPEYIVYFRFE